jgi:hypothetical protein
MPSPQPARKRPWYLVAALLGALAFGMSGGCSGWQVWTVYHGDQIDHAAAVAAYSSEADRAAVGGALDRLIEAYDAAAPREYPLAVAMLLVSMTMVFFAMRGMAGRKSARNVLVQLVLVQAALCLGEFFLTKNLRAAWVELWTADTIAKMHETAAQNPDGQRIIPILLWIVGVRDAVFLAVRTLGSALIAFALTRPRSREFFEATSDPAIEQ